MTFVSFEVEKPYPGPMPTMEGLTATPDGASIRLVIALGGLAGEEIQTIRKGGMEFALYIERRIPFIALAFPAINLDMDCHFNLLVEPQHKRDALLGDEPNANLIHIHRLYNVTE